MSKLLREECKTLSIYQLRKLGVFNNDFHPGIIYWGEEYEEDKNRINYHINLNPDSPYIELDYKAKAYDEDWTQIKHKYPLSITDCNYGGKRWWFKCSIFKNGKYCGRRIAKLYKYYGSNYFACRHCLNLSYEARNSGWTYGFYDLDNLESTIKNWYYGGKITKKHKKYLKIEKSILKSFPSLKI